MKAHIIDGSKVIDLNGQETKEFVSAIWANHPHESVKAGYKAEFEKLAPAPTKTVSPRGRPQVSLLE